MRNLPVLLVVNVSLTSNDYWCHLACKSWLVFNDFEAAAKDAEKFNDLEYDKNER